MVWNIHLPTLIWLTRFRSRSLRFVFGFETFRWVRRESTARSGTYYVAHKLCSAVHIQTTTTTTTTSTCTPIVTVAVAAVRIPELDLYTCVHQRDVSSGCFAGFRIRRVPCEFARRLHKCVCPRVPRQTLCECVCECVCITNIDRFGWLVSLVRFGWLQNVLQRIQLLSYVPNNCQHNTVPHNTPQTARKKLCIPSSNAARNAADK